MSIWLIIWILLSIALIGFVFWTSLILYMQKQAWKKFADKYDLRYSVEKILDSPTVEGVISGYKVALLTSAHLTEDIKGTKNMTAFEITLKTILPTKGAIGSGDMADIIKTLGFQDEHSLKEPAWNKEWVIQADNTSIMDAYLTQDRINTLIKLLGMKNACAILLFQPETTLLRVDLSNPLTSIEDLEKLKKIMFASLKTLEISELEKTDLAKVRAKSSAKLNAIELEDDKDGEINVTGLSLEEDAAPPKLEEIASDDKKSTSQEEDKK